MVGYKDTSDIAKKSGEVAQEGLMLGLMLTISKVLTFLSTLPVWE